MDYCGPMLSIAIVVLAADLQITPLLGDHAVLQQGCPIPVWGEAEPVASVSVQLGTQTATTQADEVGRWSVELPALEASATPLTLTVMSGNERRDATNVVVGEVWVASGQSNMWWPVNRSDRPEQTAAESTDPLLRVFTEPLRSSLSPLSASKGTWQVVTPDTAPELTAVGLHFGRAIRRDLGVPVGIVHASWGGSSVQAWMDEPTLRSHQEASAAVDRLRALQEQGAFDGPMLRSATVDTTNWPTAWLPATFKALEWDVDGTAWFRRTVLIPPAWAGHDLILHLGPIDDIDITTFGGHRVGGLHDWKTPRMYPIPGTLVREGSVDVAVEVTDRAGIGGFIGTPEQMMLIRRDGEGAPISLAGNWKWKQGPLVSAPQQTPTALYHGMIEQLFPLHPRGVIWYQGESNAHEPHHYDVLFPAMIELWRSRFGDADMPFYFVQLANLEHGRDNWHWPELREAQRNTLQLANTGMAVCFDVGSPTDIHPKDKRTVGERLARLALHQDYDLPIAASGPLPMNIASDGDAISVIFDCFGGQLSTRDDAPTTLLEIAGDDGHFHPATATLAGSVLTASSEAVPIPTQIRYAWRENPESANLVGADELPATSFWIRVGEDPRRGPVQP